MRSSCFKLLLPDPSVAHVIVNYPSSDLAIETEFGRSWGISCGIGGSDGTSLLITETYCLGGIDPNREWK
jgi:hypothetical protein